MPAEPRVRLYRRERRLRRMREFHGILKNFCCTAFHMSLITFQDKKITILPDNRPVMIYNSETLSGFEKLGYISLQLILKTGQLVKLQFPDTYYRDEVARRVGHLFEVSRTLTCLKISYIYTKTLWL